MIEDSTLDTIIELSLEVKRERKHKQELIKDINTYNQVIEALRSGELPFERVQIMEGGQLQILKEPNISPPPPIPEPICDEEVTKEFSKKNGKGKEASVSELVEIGNDS